MAYSDCTTRALSIGGSILSKLDPTTKHQLHLLDIVLISLLALRSAVYLGFLPAHQGYVAGFVDGSGGLGGILFFGQTWWVDFAGMCLVVSIWMRAKLWFESTFDALSS